MAITYSAARILHSTLMRCAFTALIGFLLVCRVSAQTSNTDGSTPLGLQRGAPNGSYPLSDFDSVNPYNGGLNFHLPLISMGGRGGAGFKMVLPIEQKWRVGRNLNGELVSYAPLSDWWNGLSNRYVVGSLVGRMSVGPGTRTCGQPFPQPPIKLFTQTLARLTFTAPDGTEYELRDKQSNGQPAVYSGCPTAGYSRGKVFVTSDGSSATFISDDDIVDEYHPWAGDFSASGYLMLRDGTRFRIADGQIQWMRDRNGNLLSFSYDSLGRVSIIKDSLNRQVTFTYATSSALYDQITFKGFGGAQRIISVNYSHLSDPNVLRSDSALQKYSQLFLSLDGGTPNDNYDPLVVSSVTLPNNQSYHFQYNSYGELARAVMPTGAAIEYDYAAGIRNGSANGVFTLAGDQEIYRRVVTRRVLPDGFTLESQMTYSLPETVNSGIVSSDGYVVVDQLASDNTLIERERHYYYGSAASSLNQSRLKGGAAYPAWKDGLEYRTDAIDVTDGSTILRRTDYTWRQREAVSWWTGPADSAPPNDPRMVETTVTLDNNLVSKTTSIDPSDPSGQTVGFDLYNNQTDVWEYDYGQGSASSNYIRHTHIEYANATNLINSLDYSSPNPNASSVHIRSLPTKRSIFDANGIERARTTFEYDNYNTDTRHAGLINYSDISSLCTYYFTTNNCSDINPANPAQNSATYITRGNVTGTTSYLMSNGIANGFVSVSSQYDIAGNTVKVIDALGHATSFDFTDCFGAPDGEAKSPSAPSELSQLQPIKKSYAFATKITNALDQKSYVQFDYYLGRPVDAEDINGVVSSGSYDDLLDRPTQAILAVNFNDLKSHTTFSYDDTNHTITTTSDQTSFNDLNPLKSLLIYDGLGRTTETRQYESAESYIAVQQVPYLLDQNPQYSLVRATRTSNPYRPGQETPVYTTTYYDTLGRITAVKSPDNAVVSTSYIGNQALVKDQSGKKRMSKTNALGQFTDVWEVTSTDTLTYPDITSFSFGAQTLYGYLTHYDYDVLGDLTNVVQGAQTRTFQYDSLKRLTSALNPEICNQQGAQCTPVPITYEYYDDGSLKNKTNARGITAHFEYDSLGRTKSKTYLNDTTGTPSVYYFYDAQLLPTGAPTFDRGASMGRLVAVLYGSNDQSTTGSYQGYDALGRVKRSIQRTYDGQANQTYTVSDYSYDLADNLKSETYPSGRVVKTDYDNAGRISKVSDSWHATPYASSFAYAPQGAVKEMKLGNGLWEHVTFNSRLQPTQIGLGTSSTDSSKLQLDYKYGVMVSGVLDQTKNNGNVQSQTISIPGGPALIQSYEYDALNRLSVAQENGVPGWKQTFIYDRYGNRGISPNTSETSQNVLPAANPTFDSSTNRIGTGQSFGYDKDGNVTTAPGKVFTYDVENHQTISTDGNFPANNSSYTYDGDGRRVKKVVGGVTTVFVYDAIGRLVAEHDNSSMPMITETSYLTSDSLGTPRVITGSNGEVKARHDYLPFGEEINANIGGRDQSASYKYGINGADTVRQKFTQKERDIETDLDYFLARYYSSVQGRFTSIDPVMSSGRVNNPKTWNRYVYALNNPLRFTDPTGLEPEDQEKKKQKQELPPPIDPSTIVPPPASPTLSPAPSPHQPTVDEFEIGLPPVPRTGPPIPALASKAQIGPEERSRSYIRTETEIIVLDQYGNRLASDGHTYAVQETIIEGFQTSDVPEGDSDTGSADLSTNSTVLDVHELRPAHGVSEFSDNMEYNRRQIVIVSDSAGNSYTVGLFKLKTTLTGLSITNCNKGCP